MTDLLGAAGRIDDAARALDVLLTHVEGGVAQASEHGLDKLVSGARTELAAAMPTEFGTSIGTAYVAYNAGVPQVAKVRSQLGELGAVMRAVHELGGVDHVVSQGGLDAIDGAADVVRRHMLLDATDQLRAATNTISDAPFGISMSRKARETHLKSVHAALSSPMLELKDAGIVAEAGDSIVSQLESVRSSGAPRAEYDQVLHDARSMVAQVLGIDPAKMPAASDQFTSAMLASNSARAIAAETAVRSGLPIAPRLSTLADNSAVLASSIAALDQHAATIDAITTAAGSAGPSDPVFRDAVVAGRSKLERAAEDAHRIEALVSNASDPVRDAAYLQRDWLDYMAKRAGGWVSGYNQNDRDMLKNSADHIAAIKAHLTSIVDDPDLLNSSRDTADEVKELLARPGDHLDMSVVRDLMDGDTARSAKAALVEHISSLKPHAPTTKPTAEVQEALALLDEADAIGQSIKSLTEKGRWVPEERFLSEPEFVDATKETLSRARTALGTSKLVSEGTANSLRSSVADLEERLSEVRPESYRRPRPYDLGNVLTRITSYRDELAAATERAAADGGLRSISPSARPAQAAEARGRWLLRDLDTLVAPAADAPAEAHIEDAARRASTASELLKLAANTRDPELVTTYVQRAATEIQSLGDTWRMPDDVALDIKRMRDEIGRTDALTTSPQLNTALPGYNTTPTLDRSRNIASGLQSWAMFTDGPLPSTPADRLAVAARRAAGVRSFYDSLASGRSSQALEGKVLAAQVDDLRLRIADVDDVANGAVTGSVRSSVEDIFAPIEQELDAQDALRAQYKKPPPLDPAKVFPGREQLDAWIAALDDAHRQARAAAGEQLGW